MTTHVALIPPDVWMLQLFSARSAREGGIVRRKVRDVERIVGRDRFLGELERRGYHAIENSGDFIVICNNAPVRIVC
jgi:hypothetical protein